MLEFNKNCQMCANMIGWMDMDGWMDEWIIDK